MTTPGSGPSVAAPEREFVPPPRVPRLLRLAIAVAALWSVAYWVLRLHYGVVPAIVDERDITEDGFGILSQLKGCSANSFDKRDGRLVPNASLGASAATKKKTADRQTLASKHKETDAVYSRLAAVRADAQEAEKALSDRVAALQIFVYERPEQEDLRRRINESLQALESIVSRAVDAAPVMFAFREWQERHMRDPTYFSGWTSEHEEKLSAAKRIADRLDVERATVIEPSKALLADLPKPMAPDVEEEGRVIRRRLELLARKQRALKAELDQYQALNMSRMTTDGAFNARVKTFEIRVRDFHNQLAFVRMYLGGMSRAGLPHTEELISEADKEWEQLEAEKRRIMEAPTGNNG